MGLGENRSDSSAVTADRESTDLVRTDLSSERWLKLVTDDPQALPFHHPEWAEMLAECYGFRSFGLGLADTDGRLVAGSPVIEARGLSGRRRWISLPFTDACPPLSSGRASLQARLEVALDDARRDAGVGSLELRGPPASDHAKVIARGLRHTLVLDAEPHEVLRRMKTNVRNAIRAADRSGVSVVWGENEGDLTRTFYSLHTATRRRVGTPVQPRRYFALLWQRIIEPGLGFLLVARSGNSPIAGAVFLRWRGTIVYKYAASDPAAWRLRPNNAVLWHAIEWACRNGCSTLDFGRTDFANEGLRAFKRHWGADETPLSYAVIGNTRTAPSGHERIARLAQSLIRRSPTPVCRGIGRLYRYSA
jgi:CelD/BcsL family acetyltransferase involved in cellulose biosynthesis